MSTMAERLAEYFAKGEHPFTLSTGGMATMLMLPGETLTETKRPLVALAEAGTPYATRGAPVLRRIYGKTKSVRPWIWHPAKAKEAVAEVPALAAPKHRYRGCVVHGAGNSVVAIAATEDQADLIVAALNAYVDGPRTIGEA